MPRIKKSFILAALPNAAFQTLSSSLPSSLRLLYVKDYAEAVEVLRNSKNVALVVAGLYFDDSKMFELLRHCRAQDPAVPVVCCRLLGAQVSPVFLEAVRIAVESLGCSFVDFPALAAQADEPSAHRALRDRVLRELAGAKKPRRRARAEPGAPTRARPR